MKLRQQFIAISILALAVTVVLGAAIYLSGVSAKQALERKKSIDQVVQCLITLERLSYVYAILPTDQAARQWYDENSQIYTLLKELNDSHEPAASTINRLRINQRIMQGTFDNLTKTDKAPPPGSNEQARRDRFVEELSTGLQSMANDSYSLSNHSQAEIINAENTISLFSFGSIVILLIMVTGSTLIINTRLIQPITRLTDAAREIGPDSLVLKTPVFEGDNEIGTLGRTIHKMADTLIETNQNLEKRVTELNEAQTALLNSESRLRSVLAANPDIIFINDLDGRYLEIFTARDDLLAMPREELLGKTIPEIFPARQANEMLQVIQWACDTQEIQEYEYQLDTPLGKRWFHARILTYVVQDASYVMWLAQDITTNKEAELAQERRREMLEVVIELGKAATRITNLDECLQTINQSVRLSLGFDRVGLFLYDEKTGILRGAYGTDRQGNMENTSWFVQSVKDFTAWQTVLSDPKGFVFINNYMDAHALPSENEMSGVSQHITVAAWAGEKPVAVISVDNGITHRRIQDEQAEALRLFAGYAGLAIENARFNDVLEQRVIDRTAELQDTLQELEKFSYTISHDLRAPLRGVSGFAYLLESDYSQDLPDPARHHIARIKEAARTMGELIDGLLTFTRLGRQTLNKKVINMESLVRFSLAAVQKKLPFDRSEITIGSLQSCLADPALVQIVLEHLLSNAVKFTRNQPAPHIEISSSFEDGSVVYSVTDNGVGFDMKYAHKLFGVFQRLHAQDEFEGTGVGLAIVQRIIHKHGGRIWAEGEVNKGAAFHFSLG